MGVGQQELVALFFGIAASVLLLNAGDAAGQEQYFGNCGSIDNAYGPFDYTDPEDFADKLPIVEKFHFDVGVQQLTGHAGKQRPMAYLPHDLDYTLRAFPNHHLALYTMMRYYLEKVPQGAPAMRYTAACYFNRAKRFTPNDAVVHMLEGMYLYKTGSVEEALDDYKRALELGPHLAEIQYNAGLLYFELGEEELALQHAKRAYDLGFPLAGLKNMLVQAGIWQESEETAKETVN